jgi:hypothetical protein
VTQRTRFPANFARRPKPAKVAIAGLNQVRYSLLSKTDKNNNNLVSVFEAIDSS